MNSQFINVLSFIYESLIFIKDSFLLFTNTSLKMLEYNPLYYRKAMCENIIRSFSFVTLQKISFRFGGALQKKLLYERSRTQAFVYSSYG